VPTPSQEDNRHHRRSMCSELISVSFYDQQDSPVATTALLEDLSPRGGCLSLNVPLTVGLRVKLAGDGFSKEAEVRYCELGEYGYLAGIEFAAGHEWRREEWQPRHLLSLG